MPEGEKTFKIEQVRELIGAVGRKPFSRPRQVHVIANLDAVNPAGANALLKTLEEPPPTTTLILLAADLAGVLATIVSRCQVVSFGFQPQALQPQALGFQPQALGASAAPPVTAEAPPLPRRGATLAWTDELAGKPADELAARLDALVRWLADVVLVAACGEAGQAPPVQRLRHPDRLAEAEALAEAAPVATWLARAKAVEDARDALGRHANVRLVLDRLAKRLTT